MNSKFFLVGMIILAVLLAVSISFAILTSPVLNLVLLAGVVGMAVLYGEKREKEKYYEYDYDRENPNALVSGCPVAGTVYASYPNNSPGLGWIL